MAAKDDAKPPAKKGSSLIKILLIVIGAIVLIGGSVGATLVLTGALQKKTEEAASAAAPAAAGHGGAGHPAAAATHKLPPLYQPIEPPFIVNFEDQGVLRYLQIGLSVMTRDKSIVDAVNNHMPQIRNDLILLFAGQKMETLSTHEGKEKLRNQAMEKVQAVLIKEIGSPGIEDIYFTAFVLQ